MIETPERDCEQAFLDRAVVVALGSNLPGSYSSLRKLLDAALKALDEHGLRVVRTSSWWRSKAWPDGAGPDFLNGVTLVETTVSPSEVLSDLLRIERDFGRDRSVSNAPRTLDLDLVAHGRTVLEEPDLILPHPRAAHRLFVMGPLSEVAARWVHPGELKTAATLATRAVVGVDAHRTF